MDILSPEGRLLARQKGGRVRLTDRKDVSITVWGGPSWPVRFMDFYAQQGALPGWTADAACSPSAFAIPAAACAGQQKPVSVCQGRRAWLPPPAVWLFPPRSQLHCSGGWYFEWPGHSAASHPLWLRPEVFVLLAAVDTLHQEATGRTKPGVLSGLWQGHQLRSWRDQAAERVSSLRLLWRPGS